MSRATDIAWAAGLFDGEGCITWNTVRPKGYVYRRPYLSLRTTDLDVLERFHSVVGCGRILPIKSASHVNKGRKPAWDWRVAAADDVQHVLKILGPHLGERRSVRVNDALDFYKTYVKNARVKKD